MCRVLDMWHLWIFVNFHEYGKVLKMPQDAIMEVFWIFQDSEYWVSAYVSVVQGSEDAWIWLNNAWKFLVWLVKVSRGFK